MSQHPFDLSILIDGDHTVADVLLERLDRQQGRRELLLAELVANLSLHLNALEQVVSPALGADLGETGTVMVQTAFAQNRRMQELLDVLQSNAGPESDDAVQQLRSLLVEHRAALTEALVTLRAAVGSERFVELGEDFLQAKRQSPTRPHPEVASGLGRRVAAVADKVKDMASGRTMLAAADGAGLLDPQAQAVMDALAELEPKPIEILEPEQARRQPTPADAVKRVLEQAGLEAGPEPIADVDEIEIPTTAGSILARVYNPAPSGATLPLIVYVHGGGWVIADVDTYDASARALANRVGSVVVSLEYRRAPEYPFPAAHDDVLDATRWLVQHAAELGADPSRVGMVGESAGGNMVAATCLSLIRSDHPLPAVAVLIYPVTSTSSETWASFRENADAKPLNTAMMGWFTAHALADVADATDDRLNLLAAPAVDLGQFPPTMVVTASRDPLHDQGIAFAEQLLRCGVEVVTLDVAGVPHEFFGMASVVDAAAATQDAVARELRARLVPTTRASGAPLIG